MNRVDDPKKRSQKRSRVQGRSLKARQSEGIEEAPQEKEEKDSAGRVQENIGQMKAIRVIIPKEIVDHHRKVLHRPVMFGVGIEVEMVSKSFDREERTLDERIRFCEIIVIPDHFAGKRRKMDNDRAGEKDGCPAPVTPEE